MMVLTIREIIALHEKLTISTGGASGLRDIGLLESAVLGCYQSFGGMDLYPTITEKAARIAYALSKNHPFIDGNKRVAVSAMIVMLRMNGVNLRHTQQELIELGLSIADGSIDYGDILAWVHAHITLTP